MAEPPFRFAAIGLDHRHIDHQVGRLLELGCEGAPNPSTAADALRDLELIARIHEAAAR